MIITLFCSAVYAASTGLNLKSAPKKIIAVGYELELQRAVDFAEITKAMADSPFDGVNIGFSVASDKPNYKCQTETSWQPVKWKKEWFAKDAELLKKVDKSKLTDNFVRVYFSPGFDSKGRVKWDDDKRWEIIANNLRVLAWFLKESGFKGLFLDSEDYANPKVEQYSWTSTDGDYQTTCKLARKRGQQVMSAIASEYPDITLLFATFLSFNGTSVLNGEPEPAISQSQDLWVSVANGMLDKLPAKAKIVDGNEKSYSYKDSDFLLSYNVIKNRTLNLVVPQNRDKYRSNVSVAFGLYPIMNVNREGGSWYFPPLNGSRIARFSSIINDAYSVTDEYVWLWYERGRFRDWPNSSNKKVNSYEKWESILPGLEDSIKIVKDPAKYGKQILEKAKTNGSINLVTNSSFTTDSTAIIPSGWDTWQSSESKGIMTADNTIGFNDNSSVSASGVTNGCFTYTMAVKGGECYSISALAKQTGIESASITARWHDAAGAWIDPSYDKTFFFTSDVKGWKQAFGAMVVPTNAAKLVILLGVSKQSAQEKVWFDDVEVYKLL